ncbi:uncharacterized protein LOC130944672 isoform X4 [Arachis stenosperma]|uniref:uncharacterized protein LOC130944672 isoform X4 n=1 Tax=Arachis stenosperma TaxID=217475 RepID=UPI0025AD9611|nr:uncharacterized protein LOC130944672 isoform X4 [Arachis stenosperma]
MSPGSALSLLPLSSVWNPGSSARRPNPRWLFCPWQGKKEESKSNRKLDKKVQFYSKVKDAVTCLSAQRSITKATLTGAYVVALGPSIAVC